MECSNRKPRQVATVPDITHGRLTVRTAEVHPVANGNTDVNVALRSGRTWGLQAAPVTDFFSPRWNVRWNVRWSGPGAAWLLGMGAALQPDAAMLLR